MLQNTTKLKKKWKIQKTKKKHRFPPEGMGSGLERAYSRFFLLLGYKNLEEMHFGLCYLGSKDLKKQKNLTTSKKGILGKLWMAQIFEKRQHFLLSYRQTCKNIKLSIPKDVQKHFKSVFEHPWKNSKNCLSQYNDKMRKITKKSKLSLGSWLGKMHLICKF